VSADLSRLTAIVHTHGRQQSTERLINSAAWLYPQLKVLVADDSRQPKAMAGAEPVKMPVDSGVSACRNALLARVRTPYILLLTDDLELNRSSQIEKLLEAAAGGQCDIAAGELIACRRRLGLFTKREPMPGHGTLEVTADSVTVSAGCRAGVGGVHGCDVAHNFFVARTDKIRAMGGWDPQLLVDERLEFFVRARRFGVKVAVCPESVAWKWSDGAAATETRDFSSLAVTKMGVTRLIDAQGKTIAAGQSRAA
jgi:hypothetical protein